MGLVIICNTMNMWYVAAVHNDSLHNNASSKCMFDMTYLFIVCLLNRRRNSGGVRDQHPDMWVGSQQPGQPSHHHSVLSVHPGPAHWLHPGEGHPVRSAGRGHAAIGERPLEAAVARRHVRPEGDARADVWAGQGAGRTQEGGGEVPQATPGKFSNLAHSPTASNCVMEEFIIMLVKIDLISHPRKYLPVTISMSRVQTSSSDAD